MNSWYLDFLYLGIIACFVIAIIVSAVLLIIRIVKKKGLKMPLITLSITSSFLALLILFIASHSIYYKYNDWFIMGNHIDTVQKKYGDFDMGVVESGKAGRVAYYLYTDNGPIMPDHLKQYYYIKFDENGIVYSIEEGCQPGG